MIGFLLIVVLAVIMYPLRIAGDNVRSGRTSTRYRRHGGRRRRRRRW